MTREEGEALSDRVVAAVRQSGDPEGHSAEFYAALLGCAVTGLRYAGVDESVITTMATQCVRAGVEDDGRVLS